MFRDEQRAAHAGGENSPKRLGMRGGGAGKGLQQRPEIGEKMLYELRGKMQPAAFVIDHALLARAMACYPPARRSTQWGAVTPVAIAGKIVLKGGLKPATCRRDLQ